MGMPYEKVAMLVAVVCAVLFTVLLGNNFIEEAPVAVIDLDNSKYSHELIQEMDASPYIDINTVFHSAVNPKALFYRDRFAAVVYFPKDLEKNRYSDVAGQIGVFYDNTSIAQNADIMEALNTIVAEANNKLSAPETSRAERGITLRDRLLFNPQGSAAFSFISPASSSSSASSSMGPDRKNWHGRRRNMHDGRISAHPGPCRRFGTGCQSLRKGRIPGRKMRQSGDTADRRRYE